MGDGVDNPNSIPYIDIQRGKEPPGKARMIQTVTLPNGKIAEAMFYAGTKAKTHAVALLSPETGEWVYAGMFGSKAAAAKAIARAEKMVGPAERVILPVNS